MARPAMVRALSVTAVSTFVAACVLSSLFACESSAPPPRRAEIPPGCWIESGIATYGDPMVRQNCGEDLGEGVCGEQCKQRVRRCVLGSLGERRPFSVVWTNNLIDGIGTRRAVVGRHGDAGYEVTWLEYNFVSGYDANAGTMGKARADVKVRFCYDLEDLLETCDERLSAPSALCAKGRAKIRDDAWLHCEGPEQPFCAD